MATAVAVAPVTRKLARDEWIARAAVVAIAVWLLVTVAMPLYTLLSKSFQNRDGVFVGLANYITYFSNPALFSSFLNSIVVAAIASAVTVPAAFVYAYALTRSPMRAKGLFSTLALIPILAPSLLPGIALIYLFGNQGLLRALLFGHSIYGALGIVIAEAFYTFPHALLILV
ncbi:MAG: putative 2-aminoethylphosphonate ABC transporter permease subunit, partial [bacterium]